MKDKGFLPVRKLKSKLYIKFFLIYSKCKGEKHIVLVGSFVKELGYFEGGNTRKNVEISWLGLEISEITENCRTKPYNC